MIFILIFRILLELFQLFFINNIIFFSDIVFPVIDVVRMAVRHEQNNEIISSMNNGVIMEKLKNFISESCKVINNMVVALRTICNLCLHEAGENLVYANRFDILENVTALSHLNKNCQVRLFGLDSRFVATAIYSRSPGEPANLYRLRIK